MDPKKRLDLSTRLSLRDQTGKAVIRILPNKSS